MSGYGLIYRSSDLVISIALKFVTNSIIMENEKRKTKKSRQNLFLFARKNKFPNYYSFSGRLFHALIHPSLRTNLCSSHVVAMVYVCNCVRVIWAWLVMNFGFASTSPIKGGNPICQVLKIHLYYLGGVILCEQVGRYAVHMILLIHLMTFGLQPRIDAHDTCSHFILYLCDNGMLSDVWVCIFKPNWVGGYGEVRCVMFEKHGTQVPGHCFMVGRNIYCQLQQIV